MTIILNEAILGIGSNIGDREKNLNMAIESISLIPNTKILRISKFYETVPFNVPDKQENYFNCCIRLSTRLKPHTLLGACLGIEAAMGRVRKYRFCSRVIDIDLLLYGNYKCSDEDLILPHPRMHERAFVLVPMMDICENMKFYDFNFSSILTKLDLSEVIPLN